jgi:hypothetical protein
MSLADLLPGTSNFLHLAIVLGLAIRWFLVPSDRRRTEYVLAALVFATLVVMNTLPFMNHVTNLRPLKYDLYVLRFDQLLGSPGFVIAQIVRRSAALQWIVAVSYGIPHLAIVAAFAMTLYVRPQDLRLFITCFILNTTLCLAFYWLLPVCGPVYAFPDFPNFPPIATPRPIPISAICNGVPSVHMSSALLVLWFVRHWKVARFCGITFALLTAFATLGNGEHYIFDLICAIPYAWLIVKTSTSLSVFKPERLISPVRSHRETAVDHLAATVQNEGD